MQWLYLQYFAMSLLYGSVLVLNFSNISDNAYKNNSIKMLARLLSKSQFGECVCIFDDRSDFAVDFITGFFKQINNNVISYVLVDKTSSINIKCKDVLIVFDQILDEKKYSDLYETNHVYIATNNGSFLKNKSALIGLKYAIILTNGGTWKIFNSKSSRNIEAFHLKDNFKERMEDSSKKPHLTAVSAHCAPHSYTEKGVHDTITYNDGEDAQVPDGVENAIVDIISKVLNFSWNVVIPDTPDTELDGTKKFYEIMNLVEESKVDFAFCGLWISQSNLKSNLSKVNFVVLPNLICINFLMSPSEQVQSWTLVFKIFDYYVWLTLAFMTVAVAFVIYFLHVLDGKYGSSNFTEYLFQSVGVILGPLSMAESNIPATIRHIIIWWSFTCLLINNYYSSDLVSHLTENQAIDTIDNFKDLIAADYDWGSSFNVSEQLSAYLSPALARKSIDRFHLMNEDFLQNPDVPQRFAILGRSVDNIFEAGFYIPSRYWRLYHVMPGCLRRFYPVILFKKSSPFPERFRKVVHTLMATGILAKIKKIQYQKLFGANYDKERSYHESSTRKTLNLETMSGVFFALLCGYGISAFALLMELLHKYFKSRQQTIKRHKCLK